MKWKKFPTTEKGLGYYGEEQEPNEYSYSASEVLKKKSQKHSIDVAFMVESG